MPYPSLTRRAFLKLTGAVGILAESGPNLATADTARLVTSAASTAWAQFRNPSAKARPFFRWWWNGNRVESEYLRRELRAMAKAGAGGIEINPIAMPEEVADPTGTELTWLSPEWNRLLRETAIGAKNLGMIPDLIVGTGWPFGGEFLREDETIQGLKRFTMDLKGSEERVRLPHKPGPHERIQQILIIPNDATDPAQARDLTDKVSDSGEVTVKLSGKPHRLYLVLWENRFREVMLGAKGGAGPVLDHFNREAVEHYLKNMSDKLHATWGEEKKLGDYVRSLFCDSIELEGANWTGDFLEQFEKRRGYDLEPYLAFVLGNKDDLPEGLRSEIEGIRYDHSLTLAELFEERFIVPYHEWCRSEGCLSRYQAYGYPWLYTHMIDGYLIPDIPEGDQWLYNPGWQPWSDVDEIRYAIWNKYASSGGHLKGAPIISSEAMTNTSGVFKATLEYIKQATDLNIATGINHLVLHGFNYSPPEAGFPGWIRFGTFFNERNPWWPYLRHWMDYAARLSALFQEAKSVSQLAILGPTPDVWSRSGLDRNPFNMEPWYLHSFWQAAARHGYASDYLSERVLANAQATSDGRFKCLEMHYAALLVCDIERMPESVAAKIAELAEAGVSVVIIGSLPRREPGRSGNADARDAKVRSSIKRAIEAGATRMPSPPSSLQESQQALSDWTGEQLKQRKLQSGFSISHADSKLFTFQAQLGEDPVYFLSNMSRERNLRFSAEFPAVNGRTPWIWNAENGERLIYPATRKSGAQSLQIDLAPLESIVLVFTEESTGPHYKSRPKFEAHSTVQGPWTVELVPAIRGERRTLELTSLTDLSSLPEFADFSGAIHYRTTLNIPEKGRYRLDLGPLEDLALLEIEGHEQSLRWWGEKQFDLPANLSPGPVEIRITVATRLFNTVLKMAQEGDPVSEFWIDRDREKRRTPLSTGILGPVRLLKAV